MAVGVVILQRIGQRVHSTADRILIAHSEMDGRNRRRDLGFQRGHFIVLDKVDLDHRPCFTCRTTIDGRQRTLAVALHIERRVHHQMDGERPSFQNQTHRVDEEGSVIGDHLQP